MENIRCFTVGHSNHSTEMFIDLLKRHQIKVLVDVRSSPYSQYVPQFNREILEKDLGRQGIRYVFLGRGLGARHNDPTLFFEDKLVPDFRLIRETEIFNNDFKELLSLIKSNERVSIVCAEKDPFDCHRFVLVSYALKKSGIEVNHILADGSLMFSSVLEERLLVKYKINYKQVELFSAQATKEDAVEEGYVLRNKDIGYAKESLENIQETLISSGDSPGDTY